MFVGRELELKEIEDFLKRKSGCMMVYGKRKVGKTTLITHALDISERKYVYYECIKASMTENIQGLTEELIREKIIPSTISFKTFNDLFEYTGSLDKELCFVIDEYPYLKAFEKSDMIDSIFQKIIDSNKNNIQLILSGSHVGMMKDLLIEKNALYGRFDKIIQLKEFDYRDAAKFYPEMKTYDKIAHYSVFGGSPYINQFINPKLSLKENVLNTILNPSSAVSNYVENLLISDFTNTINASRIFSVLANGKKRYREIEDKLGIESNGKLSKQLNSLIDMNFVKKIYPINRPSDKKKARYEMQDNLLRFYYSYIYRRKSTLQIIGANAFYDEYIEPSITTFISHRFEEIARDYFSLKAKQGEIKGIGNIGSYYYDDSVNNRNGEFDVVLQIKDKFDFYEVKYYKEKMKQSEMQQEDEQIKSIPSLTIGKIGFICTGGYEKTDNYDCIEAEKLYE